MASQLPRRAVIDIGSNSVRLVIFSGPPRVPIAIVNEKVLCGLGDRDPETGCLRDDAMSRALTTLKRFMRIIEFERPETLDAFATAAVRDAPNGKDFLRKISLIGLRPRLISGKEEARLAGLGIQCSAPEIHREGLQAVGGDLGGGSLELSLLGGQTTEVRGTISLPVGSLRMLTQFGDDRAAASAYIQGQLAQATWLSNLDRSHLFIVGGAWRAIARVGMWLSEHPVSILDHYQMTAEHALDVCEYIERTEQDEIAKIDDVQKKRVPTLPMAAMVLRKLIQDSSAERIVVSSCGVREGLLFDRLPQSIRSEDPLFVLARDLSEQQTGGRSPIADAVVRFVQPLFTEAGSFERLRYAAALMIRMANITHPGERANHASAIIMSAPFLGIDHIDRTMLAVMMKTRFGGGIGKGDMMIPISVLTDQQRDHAVQVGRAHRLAASLRAPLYDLDPGFTLSRDETTLVLTVSERVEDLVVEQGMKDFHRLAEALNLTGEIVSSRPNDG